jgi:hypothetical protein
MADKRLAIGRRVTLMDQGDEVYEIESCEVLSDVLFYRLKGVTGALFLRASLRTETPDGTYPLPPAKLPADATSPSEPQEQRDGRQVQVADWCARAFGADHASSLPQRGIRMLEEAAEAAQAAGVRREMAHKLIDYVWDRPAGELAQELGGVGVTVLALAQAAKLSADTCEQDEIARVLAKPIEHFAKRNRVKNDAGFNVAEAPPTPAGSGEPKESDMCICGYNRMAHWNPSSACFCVSPVWITPEAAPVASQAPALEPGRTVRVDDPRFHGEGIVQYLVPPRPAYVGVRLQNGNVWEYEATKVQQIFGTLPANHWTNRQKKAEANHE